MRSRAGVSGTGPSLRPTLAARWPDAAHDLVRGLGGDRRDPFAHRQDRGRGRGCSPRRCPTRSRSSRATSRARLASDAPGWAGAGWPSCPTPAAAPSLTVVEVDAALERDQPHRRVGLARRRARGWSSRCSAGRRRRSSSSSGRWSSRTSARAPRTRSCSTASRRPPGSRSPRCAARRCSPRPRARSPGPRSSGGREALDAFGLVPGRPVRPMLAGVRARTSRPPSTGWTAPAWSTASSTGSGCRCTASATEVRVFTRSLDDVTDRLPEVVEAALALPVDHGGAGRRGDRPAARRPAAPVPGDGLAHRQLHCRSPSSAERVASHVVLLRRAARRRARPARRARGRSGSPP